MDCRDCNKAPTRASVLCHSCGLITVTMPIEKAQLYADLYTEHVDSKPAKETHLVSVGDILLVADGPAPRAKTLWERLRFWVLGQQTPRTST